MPAKRIKIEAKANTLCLEERERIKTVEHATSQALYPDLCWLISKIE
jgi:hypothetical protein